MSRGKVTITVAPDVARWAVAMTQVQQAVATVARRFAESMRRIRAAFAPLLSDRERAVQLYGPWNETPDGRWQSDLCAAWVHDTCPAPAWCDCTCHGGSLR